MRIRGRRAALCRPERGPLASYMVSWGGPRIGGLWEPAGGGEWGNKQWINDSPARVVKRGPQKQKRFISFQTAAVSKKGGEEEHGLKYKMGGGIQGNGHNGVILWLLNRK